MDGRITKGQLIGARSLSFNEEARLAIRLIGSGLRCQRCGYKTAAPG